MTVLDSRTQTIGVDTLVYATSEPESSEWGQPPASHYFFTIIGTTLHGQLISGVYPSPGLAIPSVVDPQLAAELEAWDAASDEVLAAFEAGLD
ncbi:MAG TPA: hypothetical protein ENI37_03185 [Chloroflexi bacterium]|nr:hypothetical protein [Chloroflexota bacterium]